MTPLPDDPYSAEIDTFLTWVMANRDVSARDWSDNIEPELLRQLNQIVRKARIEELQYIWMHSGKMQNHVRVYGSYCITTQDISDRIKALQQPDDTTKEVM